MKVLKQHNKLWPPLLSNQLKIANPIAS